MTNRLISYRETIDRKNQYQKLVIYCPSLPKELSVRAIDQIINLLIEVKANV